MNFLFFPPKLSPLVFIAAIILAAICLFLKFKLRKTEKNFSIMKTKYESFVNKSNDAIVLTDPQSQKIIEANERFQKLTGFSLEELAQRQIEDFTPATEKRRLKEFFTHTLKEDKAKISDLLLIGKEGKAIWMDAQAVSHSTFLLVILTETTEKKRQYILSEKNISFLHELSHTLPLFQDFDQMLERILEMLGNTLSFNAFALVLMEEEGTKALIYLSPKTKKAFLNEVKNQIKGVAEEINERINIKDVNFQIMTDKRIEAAESTIGSQMILPLAIVEGAAGIFSQKEQVFKKEDLSLFSIMISGISSLYIAYKSYQQIQELSITDSLTSLYNRRKFLEEITREVERATRYGSILSLIMLDIDYFKQINDCYGHQTGDEVLRALGSILSKNIRKTDTAARYGGEEFIIILPETSISGACEVAQRIKREISKEKIKTAGEEIIFTVSFGITAFEPPDTCETLISRTDKALYEAKRKGRNRIETLTLLSAAKSHDSNVIS